MSFSLLDSTSVDDGGEVGDSWGLCDRTRRPGRNLSDSGLGVVAVWMKSDLVWMRDWCIFCGGRDVAVVTSLFIAVVEAAAVRVGMETEAYCRRAFDRDLRRIREPVMLVMEPSES